MQKIAWWKGTDALTLITNPPGNKTWYVKLFLYRIKWKILYRLFDVHWVVNKQLKEHLVRFGISEKKIEIWAEPPAYIEKVEKKKHDTFNVLFYMPVRPQNLGGMKYLKWLYGYDIYLNLKLYFFDQKDIRFVWVDGNFDMKSIYATTDLYIRPSRHDGQPRMIMECVVNEIPYIFSRDGKPDFQEFINKIEYERKRMERTNGQDILSKR